jgi:ABC-2 type transport system permease protein
VRPYLIVSRMAMERVFAYRARYFFSAAASLANLMLLYFMWEAIFHGRSTVYGYSWPQMRTYLFISYCINALMSFGVEIRMAASIRDGSIVGELTKPARFALVRLAESLGTIFAEYMFGLIILGALGLWVFRVQPPAGPASGALFALAVLLAFGVQFLLALLVGILSFWTTSGVGLIWARQAITQLLSGGLVPLSLLPTPLHLAATVLPFQAIVHTPVDIYLRLTSGSALYSAIAVQAVWTLVLAWLSSRLLRRGLRRLDILGG